MSESAFDVVLYGADPTPAIVAVEPDSEARLFFLLRKSRSAIGCAGEQPRRQPHSRR